MCDQLSSKFHSKKSFIHNFLQGGTNYLNREKTIRFNFDFVIKRIGRHAVLMPTGENSFHGIISLNLSSAFLLEQLKSTPISSAIPAYSHHYQISFEQAAKDCDNLLAMLIEGGIIRELH